MTPHDVALLLRVLGCTYLATVWIGHKTGDARRDVHLALGTGSFLLACGGWIPSSRTAACRSYAAYMWTEEFTEELGELLHIASARRTTMMCSEALWWRCHRALISDALLFLGYEVVYIFGPGSSTAHTYASPAQVASGMLNYASRQPAATGDCVT